MLAQRIRLLINGSDSTIFNQNLKSFKYSDSIEGKSDTCEIVLADIDKAFLNGGGNLKGASFDLSLARENQAWRVGNFEIDKVTCKSPPSECTLKLNSVPASAKARGIVNFSSWEETSLQSVASDIAGKCGLSLMYDAPSIDIKRLEQEEPNLSFLKRICKNYGLSVKVHDRKLIIFDELRYEQKPAVQTISIDDRRLISYNFDGTATDIYSGAETTFKSNNIADWLWGLFGGQDLFKGVASAVGSGIGNVAGGVLNINERVESEGEAEKLAQAKLRDKNKKETTASLTLAGSFNLVAGLTVNLANFGLFSGKFLIDKADHDLSESGYTTKLQLHKVLGY